METPLLEYCKSEMHRRELLREAQHQRQVRWLVAARRASRRKGNPLLQHLTVIARQIRILFVPAIDQR